MRIGIDASNIRAGGGLTHLVELLQVANPEQHGFEQVIIWGSKKTLERIEERTWLQKIQEPLLNQALPMRLYWQRFVLDRLAHQLECNVLFTPGAAPQSTNLPCVTVCQNMLPFEPSERNRFGWSPMGIKLQLLELSQRRAFQQADGVIFLTRYAQRTVQQRTGTLKAQQAIISHGIGNEFRMPVRKAYPLEYYSFQNPFRIAYVSIVNLYKHQWHVAEAVAELRGVGFPIVLDLIGPAYRPALRLLNEVMQRVDPDQTFIRYVGSVNYEMLPAWYHQANAFVYASSCENLPIIMLEAMASGLPIASSNKGPMPEVLGSAGLFFDPENVNDIANAIQKLLTNHELRHQISQLAFEKSEDYTWQRCAKETFEFISEVANRSHPVRQSIASM